MTKLYKSVYMTGNAVRRYQYGEKPMVVWNSYTCPYAQRLIMALAQKDVPYEKRDVNDLYTGKPPEMLLANPNGLVPSKCLLLPSSGVHLRFFKDMGS